ncbi:hypothetical protein E2562_018363 [Oryza meyeriana var. granulata]|uniref:Cytochrome P450 n=1 Tax=Oryza meyeriana var. granulata TaxID=110450 RepID=A0A6G1D542_9ORYZ|nr:hypothetical protein E2562_018363 [Oryza meyeriana var. granulata]
MVAAMAASLCCVAACSLGLYLYYVLWLLPERIRADLRRQGIGGPRPSFPYGNLADMRHVAGKATGEQRDAAAVVHDYRQAIFPFYDKWRKQHGPVFTYSVGHMVFLHVSRPDLVRELSLCVSLDLGKSSYMKATHQPLFGEGILKSNGNAWAHQRRLIAPEFFPDKVKGMVDLMVDSAQVLVKSWQDRLERSDASALDLMIDDDIRAYSADVISRTCFGSSYVKGKQIFDMIRKLQKTVSNKNQNLLAEMTGLSFFFPTTSSRAAWRLNRRVRALILGIVGENGEDGNNLLTAMLRSARCGGGDDLAAVAEDFVVDNCKNIYFAGYESTAVTAAWSMMLLALHPEWQDRVRDEVREACGGGGRAPDFPALQKMKNVRYTQIATHEVSSPTPTESIQIVVAADDGDPGDAAAVPRGRGGVAAGAAGAQPRRRARSQGRQHLRPGLDAAPRHGALGRRRDGVRPGAVRRRPAAAARVPAVRRRRSHLPRTKLRHGRAQGAALARALQVRGGAVAGVQALAGAEAHRGARARRAPNAQERKAQVLMGRV